MGTGHVWRHIAQLGTAAAAEGPTGSGEQDAPHPGLSEIRPSTGQTLENGIVFGIQRQQVATAAFQRIQQQGAGHHHRFLVGQEQALAGARGGQRGLKAGGTDDGPPGPRPDYGPAYYGAFVRDLDGNKIEACIVG
jgi:hypothetical protein